MRPAEIKPAANDLLPDSRLAGPVGDSHRFAIEGQQYVAPSVSTLLDAGSPLAVLGAVVAVVVLTVNAVPLAGTLSHVSQEVSKIVPSTADPDAPAAVVEETDALGVVTPRPHRGPNIVGWRSPLAVCPAAGGSRFVVEAPATFDSPLAKVCARGADDRSTVALESPENLHPVGVEGSLVRYSNQPLKAVSGDVDEFAHVGIVTPVLCVGKFANSTGGNQVTRYRGAYATSA